MRNWKKSFALIPAFTGLSMVMGVSCSDSGSNALPPVGSVELRAAVLDNISNNILAVSLENLSSALSDLETEITALDSLKSENLGAARDAYQQAFLEWQLVAMMQIGPLAPAASAADDENFGENLGDEIYLADEDQCAIDEALVSQLVDSNDEWDKARPAIRTLSAIEYLLFDASVDNKCSSVSPINQSGSWDALSEQELEERRLSYLKAVALRVNQKMAETLKRYTEASNGQQFGFIEEIEKAGSSESVYSTTQDAFNAWATALVYIDTQTRDNNLGKPAGIAECFTTCPVESTYADLARLSIRRNLESFDMQIFGGIRKADQFVGPVANFGTADEASIDDILLEIGEDTVVADVAEAIDEAYEALDAIDVPLDEAIESEADRVEEAHAKLSRVVTLFKTDIVSLLNLTFTVDQSDTD